MTCRELILYIIEQRDHHRSARTAYDIADVIDANNLRNPDPLIFDKRVTKGVMDTAFTHYFEAEELYKRRCLEA